MMRQTGLAAVTVLLAAAAAPPTRYLDRPFDWHSVLARPPATGSAAGRADRAAFAAAAGPVGGPAWRAAVSQLYPGQPEVMAQFACATGHTLAAGQTPATFRLLRRLAAEMQGPVENAKHYFRRDRPYVGHSEVRTCDPRSAASEPMTLSYSYPSGHATFGELWGLALADAAPAQAGAITGLGRAIGDNRVACGVHYPSDVAAGRALADAIYAKVRVTPAYQADLAAARAELANSAPPAGCG